MGSVPKRIFFKIMQIPKFCNLHMEFSFSNCQIFPNFRERVQDKALGRHKEGLTELFPLKIQTFTLVDLWIVYQTLMNPCIISYFHEIRSTHTKSN